MYVYKLYIYPGWPGAEDNIQTIEWVHNGYIATFGIYIWSLEHPCTTTIDRWLDMGQLSCFLPVSWNVLTYYQRNTHWLHNHNQTYSGIFSGGVLHWHISRHPNPQHIFHLANTHAVQLVWVCNQSVQSAANYMDLQSEHPIKNKLLSGFVFTWWLATLVPLIWDHGMQCSNVRSSAHELTPWYSI